MANRKRSAPSKQRSSRASKQAMESAAAARAAFNHEFPAKLQCLFRPKRYKVLRGGRGSAKSWGIARALLLLGTQRKLRILCVRELQNSIEESVHTLLVQQIEALGLQAYYSYTQRTITGTNGTEFIFSGIKNNVTKIKSMEAIDICWVEEAEKVSNNSWQVLIPTIRKQGSEIWVSFNPDEESDPTYQRFVVNPPPDAVVVEVNWRDNPWFPEELRKEKDYLYRVDAEAAEHVWDGKCNTRSNAIIFRGKYVIESFTPKTDSEFDDENWLGPYYGADWGFAEDPCVLMKMWISAPASGEKKLYIEKESYGIGIELDDIAPRWRRDIPECADGVIRADSSRPETISHVHKKGGLNVIAAEKWPGSIEDGIAFLKSFEQIVIHPRCEHQAEEARLYKYKVDRVTGDVLTDIVDKHNHCWDGDRYAMEPAIRKKKSIYGVL